jgi:hypothetical protein
MGWDERYAVKLTGMLIRGQKVLPAQSRDCFILARTPHPSAGASEGAP